MNRVGPNQLELPAPDPGVVSLSAAYLKSAAHILDAGCGNGRNSIYLAKEGHSVTGIDKDPSMISEARTWVKALGSMALELSFREADMLALPYAVPTFEAVFATRCLQELADRRQVNKAISNLRQATVPGGCNFITAYIGTRHQQASKPHLTILSPDEIGSMYTDDGWSIVHSYRELKEPLIQPDGKTILCSYEQIVTQKPEQGNVAQPQLDFAIRNSI